MGVEVKDMEEEAALKVNEGVGVLEEAEVEDVGREGKVEAILLLMLVVGSLMNNGNRCLRRIVKP